MDALGSQSFKEAADHRKNWKEELKSQDEAQRKERQLEENRLHAQKDPGLKAASFGATVLTCTRIEGCLAY